MSKLINEMLQNKDKRLVRILHKKQVVEHDPEDFHSFYFEYDEGLVEVASIYYRRSIDFDFNESREGTVWGLLKSDEFVEDCPIDASFYLFSNGFTFNNKTWKKKTEKGSISHNWAKNQRLTWKMVIPDENGYERNRSISLNVIDASPEFLIVLDQLLEMHPMADLGLKFDSYGYEICYESKTVGLWGDNRFTSMDEILKYSQLFKVIKGLMSN